MTDKKINWVSELILSETWPLAGLEVFFGCTKYFKGKRKGGRREGLGK